MCTVGFLLQSVKDGGKGTACTRDAAEKQPSSKDLHQPLKKKLLTKDGKQLAQEKEGLGL